MITKTLTKTWRRFALTGMLIFIGLLGYAQLTIFSNANQAGSLATCVQSTIYTGATIPGSLNNLISSIQLQQGFMATLAENDDGTGSGYTFIAALSTVTVNLSELLNDKVSFIRVLPLRTTLKKGGGNTNNTFIDSLNVTWFYDWGTIDSSLASREYSIMTWGKNAANNTHPTNNTNNYIAKPNITHLLSFNEPDNTGQANMAVGEAVTLHQNLARTGYRLGSPAATEGQATVWLKDFIDSADRRNVKVDYIALHWYDWGSYLSTLNTAPNENDVFTRFKNYVTTMYKLYNKPIWITEFNANVNTTVATNIAFMNLALPWLEQQPFVERYAFFFEAAFPPVDSLGKITAIGAAYRNQVSTSCYTRNWDNTEDIATCNNNIYEAENGTLMGTGAVQTCANASNGAQVTSISATGGNRLIYHDVKVNDAGLYTLGVVYFSTINRNITIQVNGNAPQVYAISLSSALFCTTGATSATLQTPIYLNSGQNKITISESPNIDRISINYLINSITATASSCVAFSAAPVNGIDGTVPKGTTYTWTAPTVTGGITGGSAQATAQTSINQTLTNTTATAQTATYTVTAINAPCTGATFQLVVTVNPAGNWTGAVSTDWNTPQNWLCNLVPASTEDVTIANVANKPILSGATTVKSINIASGATLTLNGKTLTITGNVSGTGTFLGSATSSIVVNGTGAAGTLLFAQTTDGTTNVLNNFTFNRSSGGTATLGNKLVILNTYTPTAGVLNTGGFLVLRSTSVAATASVGAGASVGGYIVGNVTVERFIPAAGRRGWRLLAASVSASSAPTINAAWQEAGATTATGTHITQAGGLGTNGFDAMPITTGSASILYWDSTAYKALSSTNIPITNNGGAHLLFVRGNRQLNLNTIGSSSNTTLRQTGTLNQGNITVGKPGTSFSAIPNPYASAVDYESIFAVNPFAIYYVLDANLGNFGGYRTVTRTGAGTYTCTPSAGSIANNNSMRYIRSGQAFFVSGNTQFNFTEAMKTTMTPAINALRPGAGTEEMSINLRIMNGSETGILFDGVTVRYTNTASANVDTVDAPKMNNGNENIAISRNDVNLAIEQRPLIDAADTIFLKLWNTGIKNYRLDINPGNFSASANLSAYLVDGFLNTSTAVSLSENTLYDFSITNNTASAAANRFMIVYKALTVLPVNFTQLKATAKDAGIQVAWNVAAEVDVVKYEVEKSTNGTTFYNIGTLATNNSMAYNWFDAVPNNGNNLYRIKVTNKDNSTRYSNIVNVKMDKTKADIAVYPNPVKGTGINVQFTNQKKGIYSIQLINSNGQQVYSSRIVHQGGSASEVLQLNAALTKGVYQLIIFNNDKKITLPVITE